MVWQLGESSIVNKFKNTFLTHFVCYKSGNEHSITQRCRKVNSERRQRKILQYLAVLEVLKAQNLLIYMSSSAKYFVSSNRNDSFIKL